MPCDKVKPPGRQSGDLLSYIDVSMTSIEFDGAAASALGEVRYKSERLKKSEEKSFTFSRVYSYSYKNMEAIGEQSYCSLARPRLAAVWQSGQKEMAVLGSRRSLQAKLKPYKRLFVRGFSPMGEYGSGLKLKCLLNGF